MRNQTKKRQIWAQVYSKLSIDVLYGMYPMSYEAGFVFSGETHDFWEFSLVLEGSATIISEDNVFYCVEGDGILQSPNIFHGMRVEENSACKMFTVAFDGTGLSSYLRAGLYKMTDKEKRCVIRILDEIKELFGEIAEKEYLLELQRVDKHDIGFQIIKNNLELLCLSLARRGSGARGKSLKDERSKIYAETIAFMKENVERNLTVSDISREVFYSTTKLKAIFRDFTGGGVMQYFNRLKCEHIIRLLEDGESVKDIAERMEFSSPYYLSYFFKREMGMTAREYLKNKAITD